MNFIMLPMWMRRGVLFGEQLSRGGSAIRTRVPLTAVNDALRANMLHGLGFGRDRRPTDGHRGLGYRQFVLALKLFRWR